jgi:hypothetical protein
MSASSGANREKNQAVIEWEFAIQIDLWKSAHREQKELNSRQDRPRLRDAPISMRSKRFKVRHWMWAGRGVDAQEVLLRRQTTRCETF